MDIKSIFVVTDLDKNKNFEVTVTGAGQKVIKHLRTQFPAFSKFVLDGFEINGNFVPLRIKNKA